MSTAFPGVDLRSARRLEEITMKNRALPLIMIILIPTLAFAMLQHGSHPQSHMLPADPQWNELAGSMDKMHAAMTSIQPSGDTDVDFVRLMLPHHQAAIDMARTELARGTNPQIRRLAEEIVADQQSEMELMQLWLKQRQPDHTSAARPGMEH
jgi:hypothetical protein